MRMRRPYPGGKTAELILRVVEGLFFLNMGAPGKARIRLMRAMELSNFRDPEIELYFIAASISDGVPTEKIKSDLIDLSAFAYENGYQNYMQTIDYLKSYLSNVSAVIPCDFAQSIHNFIVRSKISRQTDKFS